MSFLSQLHLSICLVAVLLANVGTTGATDRSTMERQSESKRTSTEQRADCRRILESFDERSSMHPRQTIQTLTQNGCTAAAYLLLQRYPETTGLAESSREVDAEPAPFDPDRQNQWRRLLWTALTVGHDSNINRATDAIKIDIPLLNYRSLDMPDALIQHRSFLFGLSAGAGLQGQPLPGVDAWMEGTAGARVHLAETGYIPHEYSVTIGLNMVAGNFNLNFDSLFARQMLGRYKILDTSRVRVGASPRSQDAVVGSFAVTAAYNHYPSFNHARTGEFGAEAAMEILPAMLRTAIFVGEERAQGDVREFDRRLFGLKFHWRHQIRESLQFDFQVSGGKSHFLAFSPLFNGNRRDRIVEGGISLRYTPNRAWTFTPSIRWEQAYSSFPLYTYQRRQVLIEARRNF